MKGDDVNVPVSLVGFGEYDYDYIVKYQPDSTMTAVVVIAIIKVDADEVFHGNHVGKRIGFFCMRVTFLEIY